MILAGATLRFVLKVFSVLRRWRARYSVPSGCLGRTVVQNLTPDVAWLSKQDICILQTKVNKIKAVKILTRICSTDAIGKIIVW